MDTSIRTFRQANGLACLQANREQGSSLPSFRGSSILTTANIRHNFSKLLRLECRRIKSEEKLGVFLAELLSASWLRDPMGPNLLLALLSFLLAAGPYISQIEPLNNYFQLARGWQRSGWF